MEILLQAASQNVFLVRGWVAVLSVFKAILAPTAENVSVWNKVRSALLRPVDIAVLEFLECALLELLLATGLPLSDIFTTLFMSIVLVISGLVAALVPSTYKWGYYVFGAGALFYIW